MARSQKRTVLLVEDFEPFLKFVRLRLRTCPELEIVGAVSDGDKAVSTAELLQPDLILLDINLSATDGLTAARAIRRVAPGSCIIFLTQEVAPEFVCEAFEIGAKGYVAKIDAAELPSAIEAVLAGQKFLSREISKNLGDLALPVSNSEGPNCPT